MLQLWMEKAYNIDIELSLVCVVSTSTSTNIDSCLFINM